MIRSVQVKDAVKSEKSQVEKIRPLRSGGQIEKFNCQIRAIFGLFTKRPNRPFLVIWKQKFQKAHSDAGLNILGLAVFPSAQGHWDRSPIDGASRRSCQKQALCFIRLNSASHRKEALISFTNA